MIVSKLLTLIGLILINLPLKAQVPDTTLTPKASPVRILHLPPTSLRPDTLTYLSCVLEAPDLQLTSFRIFLRTDMEENLQEIPLTYYRGAYRVKLIPEMLQGKCLYYFFLAEFSDGRIVALPDTDPEKAPFKVPIQKKKR